MNGWEKVVRRLGFLLTLLIVAPISQVAGLDVPSTPSATEDWQVVCVDCPAWFQDLTDRSLQLDSAGRPHIAYGGDHLYHAWHDGTGWRYETVDETSAVGAFASLALDGSDLPHISYHDEANDVLKYARYDGLGWQIQTVDDVGNWYGHGYTALALDSMGRPHISFYDYTEGDLKYATHDGADWQIETLPTSAAEYSALALDGADRPHVVYFDAKVGQLKHAWRDGGNWHFEMVIRDVNLFGYPSLAVDGADRLHVSYFDGYQAYDLKYARRDGDSWQVYTIDDAGGWFSSLVLDESDRPHISYYVGGTLKYAWIGGTTWQVETPAVGGVTAAGWGTALALEPGSGWPRVAYRGPTGDLRYARRDGGAWQSEVVARSVEAGWGTALALDGSGRPHVSYYGAGLKYAQFSGSVWLFWTVDDEAYVGASTSLALDEAGRAHISYHDWGNGDLKYARFAGTVWQVQTVDWLGDVGDYSSLALDGSGWPHISYFDRSNARLKYAFLTPSAEAGGHDGMIWRIETVPLGDGVLGGMYTSLALDKLDQPHISFEANGDLLYASLALSPGINRPEAVWRVETVDSEGVVGRYSSLALDGADRPHIAYYDATNGRLKYAWHDGDAWQVETVPAGARGRMGRYASLALDGSDRPHVSFYDETYGDLLYAWHDGADWQVEAVAPGDAGDVGRDTALALDGAGRAHVSYYDAGNRDFGYARMTSSRAGTRFWRVYLPVALQGE